MKYFLNLPKYTKVGFLGIILGIIFSFILTNLLDRFTFLQSNLFNYPFWIVAFVWSSFLGFYAYEIHGGEWPKSKSKKIHQAVFNFSGALVGWFLLYLFILNPSSFLNLDSLTKTFIVAVIFISLNGYLPYILIIKWVK